MSTQIKKTEGNKKNAVIVMDLLDNKAKRLQLVTTRMVGMYRLLNEEMFSGESTVPRLDDIEIQTETQRRDWRRFKRYLEQEVEKRITSEEAMTKIIANTEKDSYSIGDLLFGSKKFFPKQSISVKYGNALEAAASRFVLSKAAPLSDTLLKSMYEFFDYEVQLDVACEYKGKVICAEVKSNLRNDTEKSREVVKKLDTMSVFFKKALKNTGKEAIVGLVSFRFPTAADVKCLPTEYSVVKDTYLLGYSELFALLDLKVNEKMWLNLNTNMEQKIYESFETYGGKY